jgi:choline kinase
VNVVILAAGEGQRLRSVMELPKCLAEVGGRSLLHRYLDVLQDLGAGVERIGLVVGYRRDEVARQVVAHPLGQRVELIDNPQYQQGSILSLRAARSLLQSDVLLMDGDVYFTPDLLIRLVRSAESNVLLLDTASSNTGEEIMAGAIGGRVKAVGRGMSGDFPVYGEWVGFLRLGLNASAWISRTLDEVPENGTQDMGYEELLQSLVESEPMGYELVDGLPWVEIDFPEDLERANRLAASSPA